MASSSKAILIWFNVDIVPNAKKTLESEKIEYIESKIIYHITEKIEKIISWMLDPKEVDIELWEAKVWWIFYTSKEFMVLGLILQPDNKIEDWAKLRVIRKKSKVWEWKIESLKSWIESVKELEWPIECWIKFVWNVQVEMWDYLEIYKTIIEK
jgi:translation initiation factor IF-2